MCTRWNSPTPHPSGEVVGGLLGHLGRDLGTAADSELIGAASAGKKVWPITRNLALDLSFLSLRLRLRNATAEEMVLFRHSAAAAPCMISDRKRMGFGCSAALGSRVAHRRRERRRLKLVLINSKIKPTEEISADEER